MTIRRGNTPSTKVTPNTRYIWTFYYGEQLEQKIKKAEALTEAIGLKLNRSDMARKAIEASLDSLISNLERITNGN